MTTTSILTSAVARLRNAQKTLAVKGTFNYKNLKPDVLKTRLQHIAVFGEIALKYGSSQDYDAKNGLSFSIPKISIEEINTKYKDKIGIDFGKKGDLYTKYSSLFIQLSTADTWDFVMVYAQGTPFVNIE